MIKFSLVVMIALTVLISIGLRWREERSVMLGRTQPKRLGLVGGVKAKANRWVTAAAIAAAATIAIMGGLHWIRVWQG
jgi:ABC-type Fe3+-siderophore transport system permease subunit